MLKQSLLSEESPIDEICLSNRGFNNFDELEGNTIQKLKT